ncbi:hypothetical protein DMY01_01560 [Cutibacterium avidum]|nr:hypothetical protein DMY01_01560 [Cutibacterium avidum]
MITVDCWSVKGLGVMCVRGIIPGLVLCLRSSENRNRTMIREAPELVLDTIRSALWRRHQGVLVPV